MGTKTVLGIDPDSKHTAWVLQDHTGRMLWAMKTNVPTKATGGTAVMLTIAQIRNRLIPGLIEFFSRNKEFYLGKVIVEGQRYTPVHRKKGVDPNSLYLVAQVAGACVATVCSYFPETAATIVPPSGPGAWKSGVPKKIHNNRILQRAGLTEEQVMEAAGVPNSQVNHLIDALGIGRFAIFGQQ